MVAVNFLWNPINDNIVREFDDAGSVVAEYTTEPDLYGNVVSQHRDGQTSYLQSDALGSTTELTNDAGSVTVTIRYSAFGEVTQRTGTTEIPYQYVGQNGYYGDPEAGSYSVRRRVYLPFQGSWKSVDLLSEQGLGSTYCYVANVPTTLDDPSGLQWSGPTSLLFPKHSSLARRRANVAGAAMGSLATGKKCLPVVATPPTLPTTRCGFGLYGRDTREDSLICGAASAFSSVGGGRFSCTICSGAEIVDLVAKSSCCYVGLMGHRGNAGDYTNPGGMSIYMCEVKGTLAPCFKCPRKVPCKSRGENDKCRILPDPSFETRLGWALGRCQSCLIAVHSCESGKYAGPLVEIARSTGCIVCGTTNSPDVNAFPPSDPTNASNWRCVNGNGEQVIGGGGINPPSRFCGDEMGQPPTANRPPICR